MKKDLDFVKAEKVRMDNDVAQDLLEAAAAEKAAEVSRLHASTYRLSLSLMPLLSIIVVLNAPILTRLGQMAGESQEGSRKSRRSGSSLV